MKALAVTPLLLRLLCKGVLKVSGLRRHAFGLDQMEEACDVFAGAADKRRSR